MTLQRIIVVSNNENKGILSRSRGLVGIDSILGSILQDQIKSEIGPVDG